VQFKEGVHKPEDLQVGMELQGIVTNVTDFGAFVDVGVHQDGLVHLSEISHQYVKNPGSALSVGQVVKVKVLALDMPAKRIGLSIKALLPAPTGKPKGEQPARPEGGKRPEARPRGKGQGPRPGRDDRRATPESPRKEARPETHSTLEDLIAKFGRRPR
jgi:uncharacterized protein